MCNEPLFNIISAIAESGTLSNFLGLFLLWQTRMVRDESIAYKEMLMAKPENVRNLPFGEVAGLIHEAQNAVHRALAKLWPDMTVDEIHAVIGDAELTQKLRPILIITKPQVQTSEKPAGPLEREQQFWADLGVTADITTLRIPEALAEFREIAINPQLSREELYALCQKNFPSWKYYGNLDAAVKKEQARPKTAYVFRYRDTIEPDRMHRNKNYDQAVNEKLMFLTIAERLIAELRSWIQKKRALDVKGFTITSSLDLDGSAMRANRSNDGSFYVFSCGCCGHSDPVCGPREAVF